MSSGVFRVGAGGVDVHDLQHTILVYIVDLEDLRWITCDVQVLMADHIAAIRTTEDQ